MGFLDDYEPVEERIRAFWRDHPKGRLVTQLVQPAHEAGQRWIVKASAHRADEREPAGTGYAFEVDGAGNVNRTSALENCETSAVGRALAQLGYAAKGARPSREEMAKAAGGDGPPSRKWRRVGGEEVASPAATADHAAFIKSVGGEESAIRLANKAGFRVQHGAGLRALSKEQIRKILERTNA